MEWDLEKIGGAFGDTIYTAIARPVPSQRVSKVDRFIGWLLLLAAVAVLAAKSAIQN